MEAAENCFRYLNFKSFEEVNRLTFPEYKLLMQSVRLKKIDMEYQLHLQAFLNFAVKAQKKAGKGKSKPVFREFEKFYNYEERLAEVKNEGNEESENNSLLSKIGKLLKKER